MLTLSLVTATLMPLPRICELLRYYVIDVASHSICFHGLRDVQDGIAEVSTLMLRLLLLYGDYYARIVTLRCRSAARVIDDERRLYA